MAVTRILVPLDFSDVSPRVLNEVTFYASAFKATVELIHVQQIIPQAALYESEMVIPFEETRRFLDAQIEEQMRTAQEQLTAAGVATTTVLREGGPADEVLRYAKECGADLIILGSHGHGALYHLVLGSVSEQLVDKANCPVLVVKK